MAVLISKNDRLGLGLNTLTRNIVYAILALRGLTRSVTAYKDFINIAFSQTGDDDSIDLTFNASVKLLVQPEAVGAEGFNRLDYIKTLSELTPDNPPSIAAVENATPLPDNPSGLSLEKFIYWSGIVLGCSTYPSTDYYKEVFEDKPASGDPYVTLEFVIPLDYRRYLLNQNAIAASIQPFTVYVTDPSSLPSTPWVIPPSSQYWKDPVANLTTLTALTGLPIGVSVPVLSEGSVFTLISALPDGESLGENFLEPDTQSTTEVWARSVGKTGPQGEPGTPGAGVTWRGEWNAASYIAQDAVEHLGSSWIANAPNTNKTPGTDPEWDLWVSKGNPGATGADGAAGNDGLTAYEVAVLNGFEGTEQAWLTSLKGDTGNPGPAGTISAAGSITLEQIATPIAPVTGTTLIYAKADGAIYKRAAGGDEEAIGSGGGNGDFSPLTDKALYYYDAGSGLFKPVGIGTEGQTLIAQPSSNPPIQWGTHTGVDTLTANRTYYVRTDGSDSNTGLTNTSNGAFLTIQKAVDVAASVFWAGYNVDIQLNDGDYQVSDPIVLKRGVGSGILTIKGNSSNIQAVRIKGVVSGGVNQTFVAVTLLSNIADIIIRDLEFLDLQIAVLDQSLDSSLTLQNISYKNISNKAIYLAFANSLCLVRGTNNRFEKTTTNSTNFAMTLATNATIDFNNATITMVGNPVFSKWLECYRMSIANLVNLKILGSYTGGYTAAERSRIYTSGATGIGSGNTTVGGDIF